MERFTTHTSDNLITVKNIQNPIPSPYITYRNNLQLQNNNINCPVTTTRIISENPCAVTVKEGISTMSLFIIFAAMIMVGILFIIVSIIGSRTTWYQELNKGPINPWIVTILWPLAILISFVSLFILWRSLYPDQASRFLTISVFFLISMFMSLGWIIIFYYGEDIGLSLWLIAVLFIYKFWLFVHIWYIKPIAAVFLIPMLLMYIYLMYSVAHLAYLNGIIL